MIGRSEHSVSSGLDEPLGVVLQAMLPLADRRRPSNRAALALQRAQHDRVRAVREEARAAMAVVKDLQVSLCINPLLQSA